MQYKELIYKITSGKVDNSHVTDKNIKTTTDEVNGAKQIVQLKDTLIGVMIDDTLEFTKDISLSLKVEVERTLTVLFSSPISDTFGFLPYDKKTLVSMLELFPEKKHHYIATEEEFDEIKTLKETKLNLKMIYTTKNLNDDFSKKIDYLVTVNVAEIEPSMKARFDERNVSIFPMTFRNVENYSQKEKLVAPDPSGWAYNSATGVWLKAWGNDGTAEIPSWRAPDDWGLK